MSQSPAWWSRPVMAPKSQALRSGYFSTATDLFCRDRLTARSLGTGESLAGPGRLDRPGPARLRWISGGSAVVSGQGGVVPVAGVVAHGPQAAAGDSRDAGEPVGAGAGIRRGVDRPHAASAVFDQAGVVAGRRVGEPAGRVGGSVSCGVGAEQVVLIVGDIRAAH